MAVCAEEAGSGEKKMKKKKKRSLACLDSASVNGTAAQGTKKKGKILSRDEDTASCSSNVKVQEQYPCVEENFAQTLGDVVESNEGGMSRKRKKKRKLSDVERREGAEYGDSMQLGEINESRKTLKKKKKRRRIIPSGEIKAVVAGQSAEETDKNCSESEEKTVTSANEKKCSSAELREENQVLDGNATEYADAASAKLKKKGKRKKKVKKSSFEEGKSIGRDSQAITNSSQPNFACVISDKVANAKFSYEDATAKDDCTLERKITNACEMECNKTKEGAIGDLLKGGEAKKKMKKSKKNKKASLHSVAVQETEVLYTLEGPGKSTTDVLSSEKKRHSNDSEQLEQDDMPKKKRKKGLKSTEAQREIVKPTGNPEAEVSQKKKKQKKKKASNDETCSVDIAPLSTCNDDLGQWATAKLTNTEQQNKFVRLLGRAKLAAKIESTADNNDGQSVLSRLSGVWKPPPGRKLFGSLVNKEKKTFASMALNESQSQKLAASLEDQYNKTLELNLQKRKEGNAAKGLGFQEDPAKGKRHYIDIHKVNSVALD